MCEYCEEREPAEGSRYCSRACMLLDKHENERFERRMPWTEKYWTRDALQRRFRQYDGEEFQTDEVIKRQAIKALMYPAAA